MLSNQGQKVTSEQLGNKRLFPAAEQKGPVVDAWKRGVEGGQKGSRLWEEVHWIKPADGNHLALCVVCSSEERESPLSGASDSMQWFKLFFFFFFSPLFLSPINFKAAFPGTKKLETETFLTGGWTHLIKGKLQDGAHVLIWSWEMALIRERGLWMTRQGFFCLFCF